MSLRTDPMTVTSVLLMQRILHVSPLVATALSLICPFVILLCFRGCRTKCWMTCSTVNISRSLFLWLFSMIHTGISRFTKDLPGCEHSHKQYQNINYDDFKQIVHVCMNNYISNNQKIQKPSPPWWTVRCSNFYTKRSSFWEKWPAYCLRSCIWYTKDPLSCQRR